MKRLNRAALLTLLLFGTVDVVSTTGNHIMPADGCLAASQARATIAAPSIATDEWLRLAWPATRPLSGTQSPKGPCQCYGQQDASQYCIGYGGTCEQLDQACLNSIQPTCAHGAVCQVNPSCWVCGIETDGNGNQIGWTAYCTKTWGCYACD